MTIYKLPSLQTFYRHLRLLPSSARFSLHQSKIMASEQQPWHAAFPKPTSPAFISREDTLALFSTKTPGKDFILIDVRRTDFEVFSLFLF